LTAVALVTIVMTMSVASKRTLTAAEFKAKCLAIMDDVAATGDPVLITKRGKPVARLVPAHVARDTLVGFWREGVADVGDVVAPTGERWDAATRARR